MSERYLPKVNRETICKLLDELNERELFEWEMVMERENPRLYSFIKTTVGARREELEASVCTYMFLRKGIPHSLPQVSLDTLKTTLEELITRLNDYMEFMNEENPELFSFMAAKKHPLAFVFSVYTYSFLRRQAEADELNDYMKI